MNQASTGAALWLRFIFRWIIRPLLTVTLGLVVVVAVGILTVDRLVSNKLLNADFYAEIISQQDTYNRIYDEVLLEDDVRRASGELFPAELVSHEDLVGILRNVVPPEYLRGQVEGVIDSIIEYLREDGGGPETDNTGQLEIYVELGPALARVKPVAIDYVRERIGRMPEEQAEDPECTPGRVRQLGERYSDLHDEIAAGRTPASIPSIKVLPEPCRAIIFDAIFGALEIEGFLGSDSILGQRGLDLQTVEGLRELSARHSGGRCQGRPESRSSPAKVKCGNMGQICWKEWVSQEREGLVMSVRGIEP